MTHTLAARWSLSILCGLPLAAQTRVDLRGQSRNPDFSLATSTKPAKTGAGLPATCSTGELYFRTDSAAGQNLHGCTATNTWSVLGDGGSGVAAFSGLPELRVTLAGSVYTVAAGSVRHGSTVTAFTSATLTAAPATDTGTIRFFVDFNGGTPVIGCVYAVTFLGMYTPAGMTCTGGTTFPANSAPLATADVVSGALQNPVDQRAIQQQGIVVKAGTNLLSTITDGGRSVTLGVDTALVPTYLAASASLDFASIANGACGQSTFTLTGAAVTDRVAPLWPAINAGLIGMMRVSAADTVEVRVCNLSGSAVDPGSLNFGAMVLR